MKHSATLNWNDHGWLGRGLLTCCTGLLFHSGLAEVRLAPLFSDNMVLQRESEVPVWGMANAGESISVTVGEHMATARAGRGGDWMVRLPAMKTAEEPFAMTVAGATNTVVIRNVLVGDVWLCSGQSNMQKPIGPWPGQKPVLNREQEIAEANYPSIRLFNVEESQAFAPQTTCRGKWEVCGPQTAGRFSAAAYFFARQLVRDHHGPVGLITATAGGTLAQAWTSIRALRSVPTFRGIAERGEELAAFAHQDKPLRWEEVTALPQKFKQRWWREHDPGLAPGREWTSISFDDSGWKSMEVPKNLWRYVGLPDFEGMVWYRRVAEVPAEWSGKELVFSFSGYSQEAAFYFNGRNIDTTRFHESPDQFKIPAALIQPGKNVIAVRVIGVNGGGGILGDPHDLYLSPVGKPEARLPLAGPWRYRIGLSLKDVGAFPIDYNAALPGTLFNGMIHPLAPYSLKGVLWYQGESDMTGGIHQPYRDVLGALIKDWRSLFGREQLPFLVVQLPNVGEPEPDQARLGNYARVREAQLAVSLHTAKVGLVTTVDVGEPDIHPRNKQEVGRRLALLAEGMVYGKADGYSGPIYAGAQREDDRLRLRFVHTMGGLATKDGGPVMGFSLAGKDKRYYAAEAVIDGDTVLVSSAQVREPMVVRYAMADNPVCNLVNTAGLPASPFRSDCPDTIASPETP